MKMWIFNCREVSRLVSESMDREMSLGQRLGIRFHLLMCRYCARFGQQLKRIRILVRRQTEDSVPPLAMDTKAKDQLKRLLKESSRDDKDQ